MQDVMDMRRAAEVLVAGGVVVFPTETSYGLGCDATNVEATNRLADMKGRASNQALSVLVADVPMAEHYADVDETTRALARKHWPGPLTMVLHNARGVAPACIKNGTLAMRVSSHPTAMALVQALGRPLVATSANVHGQPAAYSVASARAQFDARPDQPDGYVDGGVLPPSPVSMIIECVEGKIVVHRGGAFKL